MQQNMDFIVKQSQTIKRLYNKLLPIVGRLKQQLNVVIDDKNDILLGVKMDEELILTEEKEDEPDFSSVYAEIGELFEQLSDKFYHLAYR